MYIRVMPLAAGTHLGPYRIVALLGSGGMGEVYRAHDARLGRDVAIKVLPEGLVVTPEVRARFEREARTISQLSHPNICALFDRGHQDGIDFLVMELIEGQTLAQRLDRGPLPVAEVLALGRQIAEALDRAHRAGVVHRDLKPGNVMLTKGVAKLMDFGLARPAGPAAAPGATSHSPTRIGPLTDEGTIVGTFQYMAPEQLAGQEADARTDLWALGCVLYEMATGARAFEGDSQAGLIAAIMAGAPRPIAELSPVTPPGLDRLIQRCLQKDPDARIQSALDVAFVLDLIAAEDPRGAPNGPAAESGKRRAAPALWMAVAALVASAAFLAGRVTAPPSGEGSIRVSTLSQGTRDSEPGVSPDGRMVAFSTVRQHDQGLWLMDMATRGEVKLSSEDDHNPRFTPDGGTIVFTRTQNGRQSLWRVPAIGGAPRLLLEDAGDADVSPDGDRIAYVVSIADSAGVRARLMVAKSDGTGGRELWSRGSVLVASPRWSPDGRRVVVFRGGSQNTASSLVVVDVQSGSAREYPAPNGHVLSNAIWDGSGHGLIVAEGVGVTAVQRGASGRLFRLDARSGEYRPLGWLENFPAGIDLLPDGRLVLWSPVARQNLLEVALDARDLNGGRWLTSGLAIDRQPVYSPDGGSIMFSSNRGGTLDLWEVSIGTGEIHRVTDDPDDDWDPEYGPDGRSLFWCSGRSGAFEIWTARRDGTAPRQVSRDSLDAENPSVTPDNRSVIYSSANPGKTGLWRVSVTGDGGELLHRTTTLIPDLSPDGRHVSVITDVGTIEARLCVFDLNERKLLPGAVPLQVVPGTVQMGRSRFTPDGNSIVFVQLGAHGEPVLVKRPLSAWRTGAGGAETLFPAATEGIESFAFSPDGKRATVSVVDWLSSLTIAEGVRGIVPPKRTR
jgi:Tol biopolymer transport system component